MYLDYTGKRGKSARGFINHDSLTQCFYVYEKPVLNVMGKLRLWEWEE
jgi:hypothetical protein